MPSSGSTRPAWAARLTAARAYVTSAPPRVRATEDRQPVGEAAFQGRRDGLAGTDLGIGGDPVFEVEDDRVRAGPGGLLDHLGPMAWHKEEAAQDPRRARHGLGGAGQASG